MNTYNLLFSIDDHYLEPLMTTLFSIHKNMTYDWIDVYVLQKEPLSKGAYLDFFCQGIKMTYHPVITHDQRFQDAPILKHWNETIYYRLLAHEYLPENLDRILYLDADILCINGFEDLYHSDFQGNLYAAAGHSKLLGNMTDKINRIRLHNEDVEKYINTGVLLMNLPAIRQDVHWEAIHQFIEENRRLLFLPDQDVINGLYGARILIVPDEIYNYDVRIPQIYELSTNSDWDLDQALENAVFLHFCGKEKPWQVTSNNGFTILYKHYWYKTKKFLDKQSSTENAIVDGPNNLIVEL